MTHETVNISVKLTAGLSAYVSSLVGKKNTFQSNCLPSQMKLVCSWFDRKSTDDWNVNEKEEGGGDGGG